MSEPFREASGRPGGKAAGPAPPGMPKLFAPLLGVAVVLVSSLSWAWSTFGSVAYAMAYVAGHRLVVEPAVMTLEVDQPGRTYRSSFRVTNLSGRPITVVGASSGCTCATGGELPVELPARGSRELSVEYRYDGRPSEQAIRYFTDSEAYPTFTVGIAPVAAPGRPD